MRGLFILVALVFAPVTGATANVVATTLQSQMTTSAPGWWPSLAGVGFYRGARFERSLHETRQSVVAGLEERTSDENRAGRE